MSGKKATGKTIGEVERITGIPKRELKYFIEQRLIQPSQKSDSGYWLYGDSDIRRVQLASLCRTLDFPVPVIRAILADPDSCWPEELERQVSRLADQRDRVEAQLNLANRLRYVRAEEALRIYCDEQAKYDPAAATGKIKMEV